MSSSSQYRNSRGSKDREPEKRKSSSTKRNQESSDEELDMLKSLKKSKTTQDEIPTAPSSKGLTIKLKQPEKKKSEPKVQLTKKASVFGESSDSDETEEMPPEARMRMKNIGRDTQTSAGPNSFGKTRQGFCDAKKVFERQLKKAIEESDD